MAHLNSEMGITTPEDTVRTLFKAALQVVPLVGGAIAELTDLAPSGAQRRIQETLREVAKELARLGTSISAVEERGRIWKRSSWLHLIGSTGSIINACWNRSATSRRPKPKKTIIDNRSRSFSRCDSIYRASS